MKPLATGNLELRFSLVGPGKVGISLARWLLACGAEVVSVAARRIQAATEAVEALGGQPTTLEALDSSGQDLLLLAVSDSALEGVATVLSEREQARIVLHSSGIQPVETLAPLRSGGSSVGGLHPLRAFPQASSQLEEAANIIFGIGGDPEALTLAQRLTDSWRAESVVIPDESRTLYHLAASLAAGGVVTLLATAEELATSAKLSRTVFRAYLQLAHQALTEAEAELDPAAAITGPVARGDVETLGRHLRAVASESPATLEMLVAVSRATLRQRERVGRSFENDRQIRSILANSMERKSFLDRK